MNTDEMQVEILLDAPIKEVLPLLSDSGGKKAIAFRRLTERSKPFRDIPTTQEVEFEGYTIRELESGTIEVEHRDEKVLPVKPKLRELASKLNVGLLNSKGNVFNTRQLGTQIIQSVQELSNSHSASG